MPLWLFLCYSGLDAIAGSHDLSKISKPGVYQGYSVQHSKGFKYSSHYIVMRDSVLIAADVYLPRHIEPGKKVPTILYLTRYVRSIRAKTPLNLLKDPIFGDTGEDEIRFFTSYGYACVLIDVRGTGASTGDRKMEFNADEVADGNEIVNWIAAQPWSDGQIGCTGSSYVGTTAELLLSLHNPHVKACIPRSAIFDLYDNIVFENGLCPGPFIKIWGSAIRSLDANDFRPFSKMAKLVMGIHPVKGDKGRVIWKRALALHKSNFDVIKGVAGITFRDDVEHVGNMSGTLDDFSVHTRIKAIESSGVPIYLIDGWYDAGMSKGNIDAWMNASNVRKVLMGPWDHGPTGDVSPYAKTKKITFNINLEMLRFFDHYLKGIDNDIDKEPILTYYTIAEEKWDTAGTWPVSRAIRANMYLSADRTIQPSKGSSKKGIVNYTVDYTASTGPRARWNSLVGQSMIGPTDYPDRSEEDKKLLSFTSDTMMRTMSITGTPVAHLTFSADAGDADVFCYIEDVAPDGHVTYVTEGLFRPIHRKILAKGAYKTTYPYHSYTRGDAEPYHPGEQVQLDFDLLPISYQFSQGHRIRISIAGADAGHFNLPSPGPTSFQISNTETNPSWIELPVVLQ